MNSELHGEVLELALFLSKCHSRGVSVGNPLLFSSELSPMEMPAEERTGMTTVSIMTLLANNSADKVYSPLYYLTLAEFAPQYSLIQSSNARLTH